VSSLEVSSLDVSSELVDVSLGVATVELESSSPPHPAASTPIASSAAASRISHLPFRISFSFCDAVRGAHCRDLQALRSAISRVTSSGNPLIPRKPNGLAV
jgi:hypothetical protein